MPARPPRRERLCTQQGDMGAPHITTWSGQRGPGMVLGWNATRDWTYVELIMHGSHWPMPQPPGDIPRSTSAKCRHNLRDGDATRRRQPHMHALPRRIHLFCVVSCAELLLCDACDPGGAEHGRESRDVWPMLGLFGPSSTTCVRLWPYLGQIYTLLCPNRQHWRNSGQT